jgi:hypothetical protein
MGKETIVTHKAPRHADDWLAIAMIAYVLNGDVNVIEVHRGPRKR